MMIIDQRGVTMYHTFGCKQTVSNMLTTFSVFAAYGDAHGAHPVNFCQKEGLELVQKESVFDCNFGYVGFFTPLMNLISPSPGLGG